MGKAGTKVIVRGFDFQLGYRTRFYINNNRCKLLGLSDTTALIEIPEGCGSGLIQILIDDNIGTCTGYSFEGNHFRYIFEEKHQVLKYIIRKGDSFEYFQDECGRTFKEKHSGGSYNMFSYDNDGLLDTVFQFDNKQVLVRYSIISREDFNSKATINTYNTYNLQNSVFFERIEYYYSSGIIQDIKTYWSKNGNIYLGNSREYIYSNQNRDCIIKIKQFDANANIIYDYTENYHYDIFNKKLDKAIPGLPETHSYSVLMPYNRLIFNSFGNLVEFQFKNHVCSEFEPNTQYIYE
jgi:hypothetical protein